MYYLQSRYYDPEVGRIINADAFASTGQGVLGNNMFAYCGNNPVTYSDPKGMWTITISAGYDVTLLLFGLAVSFGLAIDDDLNIVIQASYSAPSYLTEGEGFYLGLADAGISASLQVTDDDTVYDLEGPSCYAGCSLGVIQYASVDLVYSGLEAMDEENSDALPNGVQFNLGLGIGLDVHFRQSHTETIYVLH